MEVVKGGTVSSIAPPAPEADNPLTVTEALNAVNLVLLNYRGFDKVKQILAAAQATQDQQEAQQAALDSLTAQVDQMKATLSNTKGQVTKAQNDREKALSDIAADKQDWEAVKVKMQEEFSQGLKQQQEEFDAQLKEQARVAQVNLEDSVAGLKREQGSLAEANRKAQEDLDALTKQVTDKNVELASVQSRLDTANAALDALKARL